MGASHPPDFRHVLEQIAFAFVVLDGEWRYTYANRKAGELLGREPDDLIGRHLWSEVPEALEHLPAEAYERAMRDQQPLTLEVHSPRWGRWFENRLHPSPDGLLILFQDVTERKAAETALRRSETRLLLALESTEQGLWDWNVPSGAVHYGVHWERMLGLEPGSVPGHIHTWQERVHPDDLSRVLEQLRRHLGGEAESYDAEYRLRTATGEWKWILDRGKVVERDAQGLPLRMVGTHTDITLRKQQEEALRQQTELLLAIVDHVPVMLAFHDAEGRFLWVNRAWTQTLGWTLEETRSRDLLREFYPDEEQRARVREFMGASTGEWADFLTRTRSGTLLQTSWANVRLSDGRRVGIGQDITARKRAEASLRESEERYRILVDLSPDVILVHQRGAVTFINAAGAQFLGAEAPEALLGRPVLDFVHPDSRKHVAERMQHMLQRGEPAPPLEEKMLRLDGSIAYAEVAAIPLPAAGEPAVQVVARDVTARKQAEAHYRRLVEALSVGIYVLDGAGRFTEINPAAEAILGRSAGQLAGEPFAAVIAPGDAEHAAEAFRQVASGELTQVLVELGIVRPSGERRLLQVNGNAIREDGHTLGVLGIARDITDDRAREEQLRRAERLASLGTLIGGVAHELNNPLAAIKSFAQLMLVEARDEEDHEALVLIRREADRAARIVSDLRLLARRTQVSLGSRERVDLNDVVRHVLRLRRYALSTANIELVEELAEALPPVWAERGELEQVVLNLLVNAEQALTRQSDPCTIRVGTTGSAGSVTLHVSDNGPGIPTEHLERIFDPFFTTKAPGEGTGLGLALVHRIVAEHGGEIRVESSPGRGARFVVELPVAPQPVPAEPAPAAQRPRAARSLRVLLVEDEEAVRRAVVRLLTRRGHRVDEAREGGEALQRLREGDYDVILSDLRMPGLGGEEFIRALRERDASLEQRLIIVTGDEAGSQSAGLCIPDGVPVLPKPFDLEELTRLVEQRGGA